MATKKKTFTGTEAIEKFSEKLQSIGHIDTPLYPFKAGYIRAIRLDGESPNGYYYLTTEDYDLVTLAIGEPFSLPRLRAFLEAKCNAHNVPDLTWPEIKAMIESYVVSKAITLAVAEQWFKVSRGTLKRAITDKRLRDFPDENGYHRVFIEQVSRYWPRRDPPQKQNP